MNRFWSVLFLLVPVMGLAIVLGAAGQIGPMQGMWLPEGIGPRAESIDELFTLIHLIIGIVFAVTGVYLAFALWKFSASPSSTSARYIKKNYLLEFLWTIIPAGILVLIAYFQLPVWNENKVNDPREPFAVETEEDLEPPLLRVVARQYDWRFVYPGRDNLFDTADDLISISEIVVPVDELIVIELKSEDVIHSFCINELRLKQDIIPGLLPKIWFEINQTGNWDVICTELCGPGHFRMRARITAKSKREYTSWLRELEREQFYYSATTRRSLP